MQYPTDESINHELFAPLCRWQGDDAVPEIPLEWTIQAYENAGVGPVLVSAWWGPDGPLLSNAYVADHPELFVGIGSVPLDKPMEAVAEVRRCVNAYGFVGTRNVPWLWERPPDDRRYYPVCPECVQRAIPFCLQVGPTGPLKPSEMGRPIPYLDNVAREFPDRTIVAGHVGHPLTEETMALATRYENVYVATSAYKPKRCLEEYAEFLSTYGRETVLFGTNYPMIRPGDCLEGLDELGRDDETLELFLYGNAERAFGTDLV